jgi:Spy/CpxP family protein refolding chaperone
VPVRASLRLFALRASLTLVLVACVPAQIDSAYWWRSPRFVAALRLTPAQSSAIEQIYRQMLPERIERAGKAEAGRARLEHLLDSHAGDEELEAAASQAADADAARRRVRTLMLYRMSRVLTPEQRSQLAALAGNWRHAHRDATR